MRIEIMFFMIERSNEKSNERKITTNRWKIYDLKSSFIHEFTLTAMKKNFCESHSRRNPIKNFNTCRMSKKSETRYRHLEFHESSCTVRWGDWYIPALIVLSKTIFLTVVTQLIHFIIRFVHCVTEMSMFVIN